MNLANEGTWDRGVRIMGGIALLAAGWGGLVGSGMLGLLLSVLGFVVLATGLVGWCPAYTVFGISTGKDLAGPCQNCHSGRRA